MLAGRRRQQKSAGWGGSPRAGIIFVRHFGKARNHRALFLTRETGCWLSANPRADPQYFAGGNGSLLPLFSTRAVFGIYRLVVFDNFEIERRIDLPPSRRVIFSTRFAFHPSFIVIFCSRDPIPTPPLHRKVSIKMVSLICKLRISGSYCSRWISAKLVFEQPLGIRFHNFRSYACW